MPDKSINDRPDAGVVIAYGVVASILLTLSFIWWRGCNNAKQEAAQREFIIQQQLLQQQKAFQDDIARAQFEANKIAREQLKEMKRQGR